MSQHDYVIDNGSGLGVRTDINAAIQALASTSLGAIEPTLTYAGQLWLDTSVAPNGQLRQRNLANAAWVSPATLPATFGNVAMLVITTSQTYTKPAGLRFLRVEATGGGGAGGGPAATSATQNAAGGPGGVGARGVIFYDASALPASFSITVGAGGTGFSTSPGGAGGATVVNSLSAGGGSGGTVTIQTTTLGNAFGGAGGTASGFTLNVPGESGGASTVNISSAPLHFKCASASGVYGRGGTSVFGTNSAGASAGGYGAAGQGAISGNSQSAVVGGNGAPGLVLLTEYY